MENQRLGRAQPYSNNNNVMMNVSQQQQIQQQQQPNNSSPNIITNNNANSQGTHKGFGQSDVARSKTRSKGYSGERHRNNGNRSSHHDQSGAVRQRRPASCQQGHEVKKFAERSGNSRSTEKVTRHGESASHLLNFTYAPLPSQEKGRGQPVGGARRVRGRRQVIHTKEQFLQAHCQFVVKKAVADVDYVQQLTDADKMVDWEDIEQVVLRDEQMSSCPICMDVPIAPKITKCAHIYCWPCMLHYLSLADRAWGRCPICFDSVEEKDLKSVVTTALSKPKVGEVITLHLMKRERESLYVRPKTSWRASDVGHLFSASDDAEDVRYSKILSATVCYLEDVLAEERRQLLELLNDKDTQSLEASFVQAALESLSARVEKMGIEPMSPPTTDLPASESVPEAAASPCIKSAPSLATVSYSDAFEEISIPVDQNDVIDDTLPAAAVTSSPADAVRKDVSDSMNTSSEPALAQPANVNTQARSRTISSASSSDGVDAEQIAANLVLPPTGTQPGHSSGSKRTEVYYFYQAADGQHIYLHSINTRMLAAQYGSLEMAPAVLTAAILEAEDNSMTLDLRKRLKYLSHLPLYTQFCVCEVALKPAVVSLQCRAHFDEELSQRRRMRSRRQRTEARQYNRAQAEERRKMGRYPDMGLPLDSDSHFPSSSTTDSSPPSLTEFAPLVDTQSPPEQTACEHAVPSRQHEVPLTTPYSFAQAMKGSSDGVAVWPRVQSNYTKSSVSQASAAENERVEEGAAPSFQQSFSAGFSLPDLNSLSVGDGEEPQTNRAGKKGRNKKKNQVLFTTSSHRGNI